MPKYGRRKSNGGNKYFKRKTSTKPTKNMAKFIRTIVSQSVGPIVSYPRTDPKTIKEDRSMRRLVRLTAEDLGQAKVVTAAAVGLKEAGYYSKEAVATARWNKVKFLAITVYGTEDITDDPIRLLTHPGNPQEMNQAACSYSDAGDKNHRACIKMIMPPTQASWPIADTGTRFSVQGEVAFVDCYVEFV